MISSSGIHFTEFMRFEARQLNSLLLEIKRWWRYIALIIWKQFSRFRRLSNIQQSLETFDRFGAFLSPHDVIVATQLIDMKTPDQWAANDRSASLHTPLQWLTQLSLRHQHLDKILQLQVTRLDFYNSLWRHLLFCAVQKAGSCSLLVRSFHSASSSFITFVPRGTEDCFRLFWKINIACWSHSSWKRSC